MLEALFLSVSIDPEIFYKIQGTISTLATVLLVFHMNLSWHLIEQLGQKLRYVTLLCFSLLLLYASREQVVHNIPVESRNYFAMGVMILLLITMVISIRETRKTLKK